MRWGVCAVISTLESPSGPNASRTGFSRIAYSPGSNPGSFNASKTASFPATTRTLSTRKARGSAASFR